jgi:hypothetical protein
VTAHPTDVTSADSDAVNVTAAETATTEATGHAAAMTAAEAALTTYTPTTHQHQQTAPCIHIGAIGIARLRERCRGRKSTRSGPTKSNVTMLPFMIAPLANVSPPFTHLRVGRAHNARQGRTLRHQLPAYINFAQLQLRWLKGVQGVQRLSLTAPEFLAASTAS